MRAIWHAGLAQYEICSRHFAHFAANKKRLQNCQRKNGQKLYALYPSASVLPFLACIFKRNILNHALDRGCM